MTKNEFYELMVKLGHFKDTTPVEVAGDPPENCLVIDNFAFPLNRPIGAPESAVHDAKEALMTILRHPAPAALVEKYGLRPGVWQDWMMFLLPHVAKRFGANRYDVLNSWMRDWTPSIMLGHDLPIFGYEPGGPTITAEQVLRGTEKKVLTEREIEDSYRRVQQEPFLPSDPEKG